MAAKRVASSAINWAAMAERVPSEQRQFYIALKARSDGYLRRVMANPDAPPKIDFASYKSKIPVAGLVDSLQKQYEALKVPYPSENLTPQISAQEKQNEQTVKQFIMESNARIKDHEAKIAAWDDVLPFEDMTLEDYKDMFPEQALDPLRNPKFWPFTPEEQLDYKEPETGSAPAH